jgi:hypothetical protein
MWKINIGDGIARRRPCSSRSEKYDDRTGAVGRTTDQSRLPLGAARQRIAFSDIFVFTHDLSNFS